MMDDVASCIEESDSDCEDPEVPHKITTLKDSKQQKSDIKICFLDKDMYDMRYARTWDMFRGETLQLSHQGEEQIYQNINHELLFFK